MIATLGLVVALASSNDCATFARRAAALAKPVTTDAEEGMLQVASTKASWYGGALTYSFSKTTSSHPICSGQVLTLKHAGFTFERASDLAFEALEAAFDTKTALDFSKSRLVARTNLPDQPRDKPMQWFSGKTFGYSTLTGSNALSVMSPSDFTAALAQARHENRSIH